MPACTLHNTEFHAHELLQQYTLRYNTLIEFWIVVLMSFFCVHLSKDGFCSIACHRLACYILL
ncbi:MAG: hypothetical protein QF755_01360 [Candidatus Peribacteraceae bacterium]|nr:hypothetical protein [Candidatus Peribacteraceae bacterium]